jgi:type III pantothenate kinase
MILAIDRGNTRCKLAIFDKDIIVFESTLTSLSITYVEDLLKKYSVKNIIYCSVNEKNKEKKLLDSIKKEVPLIMMSSSLILPIKNMYSNKKTLGGDRLASIVGAYCLYKKATLVIDAGTCITYDFLNDKNEYLGGSISLGIGIKYKALHNFTAKLPLINQIKSVPLCCKTTEDCIISGVINGTIMEVEGIIDDYKKRYGQINVVLTGGDAKFIQNNLKTKTIIEENLILYGLKNILDINAKEI